MSMALCETDDFSSLMSPSCVSIDDDVGVLDELSEWVDDDEVGCCWGDFDGSGEMWPGGE